MLRTLRTLWRLIGIARILARHDALAPLDELGVAPTVMLFARRLAPKGLAGRPGQKLARALTELGPTFIKLGQFLSTRSDLLGEQLAADLSELQDSLPPFPSGQARATITAELGRAPDEIFQSFDDEPISAASIAQVHLAVVRDDAAPPEAEDWAGQPVENWAGREVAVKILRPGVEQAFARDLELFYTLADWALRAQPKLARFKPREVVRLFEDTVRLEMDLRMEAAAASELADNFADDPTYRVPPVNWQLSSRRILTQGRVDGIPMDDRAALLAAGHNLTEVLDQGGAEIFFKQVFRDGLFHGDQHPGNMWVDPEGNDRRRGLRHHGPARPASTRYYLADMLLATLDAGLSAGSPRCTWRPATCLRAHSPGHLRPGPALGLRADFRAAAQSRSPSPACWPSSCSSRNPSTCRFSPSCCSCRRTC